MDKLKVMLTLVQKQQKTLEFGLVALLTAGAEQIFEVVFKCPCNSWNCAYGAVFLLIPALVLLVFGLIISSKTCEMCTGLCRGVCTCSCSQCIKILISAMVAPVSWIAIALLDGDYFECAHTCLVNGPLFCKSFNETEEMCVEELPKFPCEELTVTVPETMRNDARTIIRAKSQVIGWLLIAIIMIVFPLFTCVVRCCSPVSRMQMKFREVYIQNEKKLLDKHMTENATKLAERNVSSFFSREKQSAGAIFTPDSEAWDSISSFNFNKSIKYSMLHEYVDKKSNMAEKQGQSGNKT